MELGGRYYFKVDITEDGRVLSCGQRVHINPWSPTEGEGRLIGRVVGEVLGALMVNTRGGRGEEFVYGVLCGVSEAFGRSGGGGEVVGGGGTGGAMATVAASVAERLREELVSECVARGEVSGGRKAFPKLGVYVLPSGVVECRKCKTQAGGTEFCFTEDGVRCLFSGSACSSSLMCTSDEGLDLCGRCFVCSGGVLELDDSEGAG